MSDEIEIQDYGVTVEEYLDGMEKGIDILELRSLEEWGVPTDLALELMTIMPKVANGTATPDEIVRSLMIMSPPLRQVKE
ncbi:hypothetical protein NIES4071_96440 [Calothrix sp. NIES-4071]|nr:hypothetical protein NIES4071_96440 [Calothrix sp. NIES-4071]BAZ63909.1 hypothetical protein NIES4105_96370 [Calothrix sp. NIES-4105]